MIVTIMEMLAKFTTSSDLQGRYVQVLSWSEVDRSGLLVLQVQTQTYPVGGCNTP